MTIFIIANKEHWSKVAPLEVKSSWTVKQEEKFARAYEVGDILQALPDEKVKRKYTQDKFRVIRVPDLTFDIKNIKSFYEKSQERTFIETIVMKHRRYQLSVPGKEPDVTLSKSEFNNCLIDKDKL